MPSVKRFPFWLEITLLVGLAIIFGVTYLQYKAAQSDFQVHEHEHAQ
jgi:hypothetical protein